MLIYFCLLLGIAMYVIALRRLQNWIFIVAFLYCGILKKSYIFRSDGSYYMEIVIALIQTKS